MGDQWRSNLRDTWHTRLCHETLSVSSVTLYRRKLIWIFAPWGTLVTCVTRSRSRSHMSFRYRPVVPVLHAENGFHLSDLPVICGLQSTHVVWCSSLGFQRRTDASGNGHIHTGRSHQIVAACSGQGATGSWWFRGWWNSIPGLGQCHVSQTFQRHVSHV